MQIKLVGSSVGDARKHQFATSFVVNETIAIDAGCIGFLSPLSAQKQIRDVFLSHSHIDHIGTLPSFLDTVYEPGSNCPTVYGSPAVLNCLETDIFNERVWPDLIRLSALESPFLRMQALEPERPIIIGDTRITPVELNHVVPTLGFVIEQQDSAVAIVSDTGPSEAIWRVANATPQLKAVFLEASFPNSMTWLAERALHLTPELFLAEARKLKRPVPLIAIHLKPSFQEQIEAELQALNWPLIEVAVLDHEYRF
jgi:cAMP phosphodiesterase